MGKLIISMEGTVLKEIPLEKERTTIGRKPHNDIMIDNLAISGEHAVVITILNDSFLEDMGSTNGTFVNGHQIKKHFLQTGDVIELGKYRLKYVSDAQQSANKEDFEKTMVLRPGMVPKPVADSAPLTAVPAPPSAPSPAIAGDLPVGVIQVLSGGNAGKQLELVKTLTTLGKPGVQVAVIAKRPQGYFITHVEGDNFPIINGEMISSQARQLGDHDVLELAGVKMEFFLKT
jgi:pSer/pThr/pTyr-binding forkhead associated (FHA) protein